MGKHAVLRAGVSGANSVDTGAYILPGRGGKREVKGSHGVWVCIRRLGSGGRGRADVPRYHRSQGNVREASQPASL